MASDLPIFNRSKAVSDLADNQQVDAVPTSIVIEQLTGDKNLRSKIIMSGRCLPFQGTEIGLEQRIISEKYAGASEKTVQVLGPSDLPVTMEGRFATRHMLENDFFIIEDTSGTRTRVDTAEWARKKLFEFCKQGQEVRVSWGQDPFSVSYIGLIRQVTFPEKTPLDIRWSMDFEWITVASLRVDRSQILQVTEDPKNLVEQIEDALEWVDDRIGELRGAYQEYVQNNIVVMNNLLSMAQGLVDKTFDLATLPALALRNVAMVAGNVKQGMFTMQTDSIGLIISYTDAAASMASVANGFAIMPWAPNMDSSTDDGDAQATSALAALEFEAILRKIKHTAARIVAQSGSADTNEIKTIHEVKDGETLRNLSMLYYGTQDSWLTIAETNDLESTVISEGMVLLIPEEA